MCSTLPQPHTHVTQKAPAARATRRLVSTTNAGSSRAHWFFVSAVHNTERRCQHGAYNPHSDSAHVYGTLCGGICAGESKQVVSVSLFRGQTNGGACVHDTGRHTQVQHLPRRQLQVHLAPLNRQEVGEEEVSRQARRDARRSELRTFTTLRRYRKGVECAEATAAGRLGDAYMLARAQLQCPGRALLPFELASMRLLPGARVSCEDDYRRGRCVTRRGDVARLRQNQGPSRGSSSPSLLQPWTQGARSAPGAGPWRRVASASCSRTGKSCAATRHVVFSRVSVLCLR